MIEVVELWKLSTEEEYMRCGKRVDFMKIALLAMGCD